MADDKQPTYPDPSKLTYEEALAALEAIIGEIEDGTIGLEESIEAYRHGTALIRRCRDVLERAEQEIEVIESSLTTSSPDAGDDPASDAGEMEQPEA